MFRHGFAVGIRGSPVLLASPDVVGVTGRVRQGGRAWLLALGFLLANPPLHARSDPPFEAAYREILGIASVGGAVLRTRALRPPGRDPFPLAIISHGSPADPAQRPTMGIPIFAVLSNWLL